MEDSDSEETKSPFQGTVRELRSEDLPILKPILEQWIRNSETKELLTNEVEETLRTVEESLSGQNDRSYIVAEGVDGQIAGIVGIKSPDIEMKKFARTENPVELVNFFVKDRGKGTGQILERSLRERIGTEGYTEIILNSGPRYKDTAWDFYDKLYDRVGVAKEYYGPGRDAPVWSKILKEV